jgi:hypothetical protein
MRKKESAVTNPKNKITKKNKETSKTKKKINSAKKKSDKLNYMKKRKQIQ